MSHVHLIFGIAVFVVFLVTGKLMRVDFPDKEIIEQQFRLLMRSRHIYILFAALIHILLGVYLQKSSPKFQKYLQIAGSVFLFAGTILLIYAFFYETYRAHSFSETSRFGLYFTLAGTVFHLSGGFRLKLKSDEQSIEK